MMVLRLNEKKKGHENYSGFDFEHRNYIMMDTMLLKDKREKKIMWSER